MKGLDFKPLSTGEFASLRASTRFGVEVQEAKGCILVVLTGSLTLGEATAALRPVSEGLSKYGGECVLLDMCDTTRIDSAGLGELVHLAAVIERAKGGLVAVRPRRQFLHSLLVETRVATLMEVCESRETAVEAVKRWLALRSVPVG
jgi:anti-sigma B factor antagonist